MIKELLVSNYRSLGTNVCLRPGALTVLIGPNGSGKSNLLDVLSFIRDAVIQGLPAAITHRGGIDNIRRRSTGRPNVHISLTINLPDGVVGYYAFTIAGDRSEEYKVQAETARVQHNKDIFEFTRSGDIWAGPEGINPYVDEQSLTLTTLGGTPQFKPLVQYLSRINVYSIFPDTLRKPQKFNPVRPMEEHGKNWVSILRELVKDRQAKEELLKGLNKLTGDIEDIRVTSAASHLIAEFKQSATAKKSKRWFEADQQSDGTLRVAGLITALLQNPPLPVIGIEEPELTVHPGVLPMLYDYLSQASEQSQIILTTHSPLILDVLNYDKDAIFVVERIKGKTRVKRVEDSQLQPVREGLLTLGDSFLSGDLQLELFDGFGD